MEPEHGDLHDDVIDGLDTDVSKWCQGEEGVQRGELWDYLRYSLKR
jgi:hypothetical protein